ncbi:MAG: ABC transporter permease [Actinomycetota bacterium]|nr:ABC transporter permease [Actinomycetota bacterium]
MITARMLRLVERNVLAYRRSWLLFISGFAEPVLFLLSIGLGVGELVGDIDGVDYQAFVAPGMLAVAAMNGAIIDTTFSFFVKYKYAHLYDGVVATPLDGADIAIGEVTWALMRGFVYSTGFLVTMLLFGLVESWWALLAVPAALLISLAFAGAGLAATTYMRSFMDFDYVNMVAVPLFLFSATFFPISQYPEALQVVVKVTPLYQGVALERGLILGDLSWTMLLNALYLVVMGAIGVRIAARRVGELLKP